MNLTDPSVYTFYVASDSVFTCETKASKPFDASDAVTLFSLPYNYAHGTHFNCTAPIPPNSVRGLQNASCLGCYGQDPSRACHYAPGFVSAPNGNTYNMFTLGPLFNASSVADLRAYLQLGFHL